MAKRRPCGIKIPYGHKGVKDIRKNKNGITISFVCTKRTKKRTKTDGSNPET